MWEKPEEEWKREEKEKRGEASVCGVAACTAFVRVMLSGKFYRAGRPVVVT